MKNTKRVLVFVLLLSMLFSAVSCGGSTTVVDDVAETPKYVIHLADLGNNVEIHTKDQAAYLNDTYDSIAKYVPEKPSTERSYPKPVELWWRVNEDDVAMGRVYEVSVSTSSDMKDAKEYTTADESYYLYNLYLGTTYYWTVSFDEEGTTYKSDVASFTTTSQGPRNLKIDGKSSKVDEGVTNCRDLGGWSTVDGNKVKQGMIYRTGKINNGEKVLITEEGKKTLTEELGVKTEIDLRITEGDNIALDHSILDGVKFLNIGISYLEMDKVGVAAADGVIKELIEVFADESNYPIFFHCSIGTDRTGMLAYLLNGLLGVSKEDLYRDYCFSNFGAIATGKNVRVPSKISAKGGIAYEVDEMPGETLQIKVRNYLKQFGITDATLDKIVDIMLEK